MFRKDDTHSLRPCQADSAAGLAYSCVALLRQIDTSGWLAMLTKCVRYGTEVPPAKPYRGTYRVPGVTGGAL